MEFKKAIVFTAIPLSLVLFNGCAKKDAVSHEASCIKRYNKLDEKFKKKKYAIIREGFSELLSTCPGTGFVEKALFQLAESHFYLKEWLEAEAEFRNLIRDFPGSQYIEEAYYKMAFCSARQTQSIERDQSKTKHAIQSFKDFMAQFPSSAYADSASIEIDRLKTKLARKELKIAKLYLKMKEYQAAAIYYKSALGQYEDHLETSAVHLALAQCYTHLNQFDEAKKHITSVSESPDKPKYSDKLQKAQRLLKQKQNEFKKNIRLKKRQILSKSPQ